MITSHSPTPWSPHPGEETYVDDCDGRTVVGGDGFTRVGNAQFALRCVNRQEALNAELTKLLATARADGYIWESQLAPLRMLLR